jgi:hypothetical protein
MLFFKGREVWAVQHQAYRATLTERPGYLASIKKSVFDEDCGGVVEVLNRGFEPRVNIIVHLELHAVYARKCGYFIWGI